MSYFSNLALEYEDIYENYSYPSPEEQLLWRLDDLYDILDELKKQMRLTEVFIACLMMIFDISYRNILDV